MILKTKSREYLQAERKLEQAKAEFERAKQKERAKIREAKNHHKFMMGGCVAKYFPDCWSFSEQEMNRIIACAFKNKDVQNMIEVVVRERAVEPEEVQESESDENTAKNEENV